MRVIFDGNSKLKSSNPVAIAIGTFDGIHLGHQALIKELLTEKEQNSLTAVVYTFLQHPLSVLNPQKAPPLIMDLKQKIRHFQRYGIDLLLLNAFDEELARTPAEDFLERYLFHRMNIHTVIVGFNFRFGYKGLGDTELLRRECRARGIRAVIVPPVEFEGKTVSSSLIRELILDGDITKANQLLGYPYSLYGKIVTGYQRGRKIGYPTANLLCRPTKVLPKFGVYLTHAIIHGKLFWGVTNVGKNPTFVNDGIHVETFFIDYSGDLYGKNLRLYFDHRIRDEEKFDSPEMLKRRIEMDVALAKKLRLQMGLDMLKYFSDN